MDNRQKCKSPFFVFFDGGYIIIVLTHVRFTSIYLFVMVPMDIDINFLRLVEHLCKAFQKLITLNNIRENFCVSV